MFYDFLRDCPVGVWRRAVREPHERRIRLQVLTSELKPLPGNLTDMFVDGSRTIDVTAQTSRKLELTLFDPSRSIRFEPAVGDFPIYLSRVIRAWDERAIPGYGWRGPPIFTGPVTERPERDGSSVRLACSGMEWFGLGDVAHGHPWGRKAQVTDVIKTLLRLSGENHLGGIPDLPNRLGDKFEIEMLDKLWPPAERFARQLNRVLLYDGRGWPSLRRPPGHPGITVDDDVVASYLRTSGSVRDFYNRWFVVGPKPPHDKERIVGKATLPPSHRGSPKQMGRGDAWRYTTSRTNAQHIDSQKDANHRAAALRDAEITSEDDLSIETAPCFPEVEEYDLAIVKGQAGHGRIRVKQETLPLWSGNQSLGAKVTHKLAGGPGRKGPKGGANTRDAA